MLVLAIGPPRRKLMISIVSIDVGDGGQGACPPPQLLGWWGLNSQPPPFLTSHKAYSSSIKIRNFQKVEYRREAEGRRKETAKKKKSDAKGAATIEMKA